MDWVGGGLSECLHPPWAAPACGLHLLRLHLPRLNLGRGTAPARLHLHSQYLKLPGSQPHLLPVPSVHLCRHSQDRGVCVHPPLHLAGVPHTGLWRSESTWGVNSHNHPDTHLLTPITWPDLVLQGLVTPSTHLHPVTQPGDRAAGMCQASHTELQDGQVTCLCPVLTTRHP